MKRICSIIILSLFLAFNSQGQDMPSIQKLEDSLQQILNTVRNNKNELNRFEQNSKFRKLMRYTLDHPEAFNHPFDSLKTISTITSPDGAFRFFNWNVPKDDDTHEYFCYLLKNEGEGNYRVIPFKSFKRRESSFEQRTYSDKKWVGMLYYNIIPIQKNNKTMYTLLAWDGNNGYTTKKIIDVLQFNGQGVKLGSSIFRMEKAIQRRVKLEWGMKAFVALEYHKKKKVQTIVFSHLEPLHPELVGVWDTYLPDGSFDALVYQKENWVFVSDYDARLEKSPKDRDYQDPRPDGPDTRGTQNQRNP